MPLETTAADATAAGWATAGSVVEAIAVVEATAVPDNKSFGHERHSEDCPLLELQIPSEFQGVCQIDSPFATLPAVLQAQMRAAGLVQESVDADVPEFWAAAEGRRFFCEDAAGRMALF